MFWLVEVYSSQSARPAAARDCSVVVVLCSSHAEWLQFLAAPYPGTPGTLAQQGALGFIAALAHALVSIAASAHGLPPLHCAML